MSLLFSSTSIAYELHCAGGKMKMSSSFLINSNSSLTASCVKCLLCNSLLGILKLEITNFKLKVITFHKTSVLSAAWSRGTARMF